MLSRAFTQPKRSPRVLYGEQVYSGRSEPSIYFDYEDCFAGDVALVTCGHRHGGLSCGPPVCGTHQLTMKEVVRSSVGVMGESGFGMTEKVVLLEGRLCAVKRFGKLLVRRKEFGRRVERFAEVSRRCDRLVPVTAYLYAKRIKFVMCDYYPMGSLADLLLGGREQGHTALNWKQSLSIIVDIGSAIKFVHTSTPCREKNVKLNVHGNVKASNVMICIDFSARLSGYGISQLAEPLHLPQDNANNTHHYQCDLCQETDIHNFGIIMLDLLGGSDTPFLDKCVRGWTLEDAKMEIGVEGKVERKQAIKVLEVAWACIGKSTKARPSIQDVTLHLQDAYNMGN